MSEVPEGNLKHEIRVTRLSIGPIGFTICDEQLTHVEFDFAGSGEFIEVLQSESMGGKITIDVAVWPVLREAIDWMICECREEKEDHV